MNLGGPFQARPGFPWPRPLAFGRSASRMSAVPLGWGVVVVWPCRWIVL